MGMLRGGLDVGLRVGLERERGADQAQAPGVPLHAGDLGARVAGEWLKLLEQHNASLPSHCSSLRHLISPLLFGPCQLR